MSDGAGTGPLPTAAEIETAVAAVLARPEFAPAAPGPLRRLLRWIGEQLELLWRMVRDLLPPLGGGEGVQGGATVMLALLGLVLAVVLVRHLRRIARATRPAGLPDLRPEPDVPSASDALRLATAAAAGGRWVEAAHALYLGTVLSLDAAGTIRWDPAATGGDYMRALGGRAQAGHFRALVAAFYPLAYGDRPDAAGAYARMRIAATALGVPS